MSDSELFLGIDGGGSKTAFVILNSENEIVYQKKVGSTALDTVSDDLLKANLEEGVSDFHGEVDSIFAGIGGIASQEQIGKVKSMLRDLKCCKKDTMVDANNDVYNALFGGLGGEDGIILIAGTGSVSFGKFNNAYARSGGYCYQEGDAGSSYDLGKKALQYLARVIDGRKPSSDFSDNIADSIKCYSYETLAKYFVEANRKEIAQVAQVVTKNQKNEYAREIIEGGVEEALSMIKAVYKTLGFKTKVPFTIIGSLGNAKTLYKLLLLKRLKEELPDVIYCEKVFEASFGAALKAKENFTWYQQ